MSGLTIEALGISKEEAIERVVQNITAQLLTGKDYDEDGNDYPVKSDFAREVDKAIKTKINDTVTQLADMDIGPRIEALIEGTTLSETNRWGEKTGQTLTFREYLVQRAEAYMTEQVDYNGKPKGTDGFSWTAKSTRVVHMIHQHLHYQIESAMKAALADLNTSVAKGLHEATRMAINSVLSNLKMEVKVK